MRLRRDTFNKSAITSSNIGEVNRANIAMKLTSQSPKTISIPSSCSKENKVRSPSPSVWLKRKLKGKNLTPILSPKRCNNILSAKRSNSYQTLSNEENPEVNTTIDDVILDNAVLTPRTPFTPKSANGRKFFFAEVEEAIRDSPSSSAQVQGDEQRDDHNNVVTNGRNESPYNDGTKLSHASEDRTYYSHDESLTRSPDGRSEACSSRDRSVSSYSQQPITKYLMLSPTAKAKLTPNYKIAPLIPELPSLEVKEFNEDKGDQDPRAESKPSARKLNKEGESEGGVKYLSLSERMKSPEPMKESKPLDRIVDLIDTKSTSPSTSSEAENECVYKNNTCVSSLTDPDMLDVPYSPPVIQRPPKILRMVNKTRTSINMERAKVMRDNNLMRKSTCVSSLTEPEERLTSMLEKVNFNAEEEKRKNITKNWWEDDSIIPSLMSPRNRRAPTDDENDYSFDDFVDSISDLLGGMCNTLEKACADDFDELVGGEIRVKEMKQKVQNQKAD